MSPRPPAPTPPAPPDAPPRSRHPDSKGPQRAVTTLTPVPDTIAEGPDNLRERAKAFNRRRGSLRQV